MSLQSYLLGDESEIIRERNFQVLLLANTAGPMGFALVTPILDSLISPFGTSAANIGLMMSAYTAPSIVLIPMIGYLSDRFGRKPFIILGLLLIGLGGVGIAFTTNYSYVLALRFTQGLGSAAIVPIIVTSIGDEYDGSREATGQGVRFTVSGLTQMSIPLIAGILVGIAWQYPFFIYASVLPMTLVVYAWYNEPTITDGGHEEQANPSVVGSRLELFRDIMSYRRAKVLLLIRSLPGIVWVAFLTFNSIIVVQLMDGTPTQAGILAGGASLTMAITASQSGRMTSLLDSRINLLIVANAAMGGGVVVLLFSPSFIIALLGIAGTGAGLGIMYSIYRSIITDLAPDPIRGSMVSISEAFGKFTVTLTPIVMGAIISALTTQIGLQLAVQLVCLATAVTVSVAGIVCLVAVTRAPAIPNTYQ